MAKQNRVTPLGDIVAIPLRGAWLGNRGIIHAEESIVRFHAGRPWITCRLAYRGWRLPQWAPHHLTVLFFHDEAVSLAAGHRPCALCRRADYEAFRAAWAADDGGPYPSATELDRQLHAERLVRGTHRRRLHRLSWRTLPSGAFVLLDDGPALVLDDRLVPWTVGGYGAPRSRPMGGLVDAITPPGSLRAMANGYRPQIDPGAGGPGTPDRPPGPGAPPAADP